MAGLNKAFHGSLPCFLWASASMRSTPGAPTERPPTTPFTRESGVPSGFWNSFSVAAAGAVSRPSYACTSLPS